MNSSMDSKQFLIEFQKELNLIGLNPFSSYFKQLLHFGCDNLFKHIQILINTNCTINSVREIQQSLNMIFFKDDSGLLNLAFGKGSYVDVFIDIKEFPLTIRKKFNEKNTKSVRILFFEMMFIRIVNLIWNNSKSYLWKNFFLNLFEELTFRVESLKYNDIRKFLLVTNHILVYELVYLLEEGKHNDTRKQVSEVYAHLLHKHLIFTFRYTESLRMEMKIIKYNNHLSKNIQLLEMVFGNFLNVFTYCDVTFKRVFTIYQSALSYHINEDPQIVEPLFKDCFSNFLDYAIKNGEFYSSESIKDFERIIDLVGIFYSRCDIREFDKEDKEKITRIIDKIGEQNDFYKSRKNLMTIAKHINNSEYINTMERRMIRKQELKEDKEKGKQIRKKKRNRWKNWNSEFSYKTEYISAFWFFYYVSLIIDTILRNEPYNPHQEENLVPDIFHKQVYYINPLLMGRHIDRKSVV